MGVVQSKVGSFTTTQNPNVTPTSNVGLGGFLLAIISWSNNTGTVTSVTDQLLNNWKQFIAPVAGENRTIAVWYCVSRAAGTNLITANLSASEGNANVTFYEITGYGASIDQSANTSNGATTTTPSTPSITTTKANELVFAIVRGGTISAGTSGWTMLSSGGFASEYISGAAAAYQGTFTCSVTGTYISLIFSLFPAVESLIGTSAAVTPTAKVVRGSADTIGGTAAVTASGKAVRNSADTIGASAAVAPTAKVLREAAAPIGTSAAVAPSASVLHSGNVAIGAEAVIVAAAGVLRDPGASIGASATVSPTATVRRAAEAVIDTQATVTPVDKVLRRAALGIAAKAAVSPTPNVSVPGSGAVTIGTKAHITATAVVKRKAALAIVARAAIIPIAAVESTGPIIEVPFVWASLLPPLPILDDIENLPTMQLHAYCRVYELPTIGISPADMRDNLRRVRQIYQGDASMLHTNDRRTLFDAWGIEGSWSTAPSDDIAIALVGFAISLSLRFNAVAYCRSPLSITARTPTVILTGKGACDISLDVEAADTAGQPLTGTAVCGIIVSVNVVKQTNSVTADSAFYTDDSALAAVDAGSQLGGPSADSAFYSVDSSKTAVDG